MTLFYKLLCLPYVTLFQVATRSTPCEVTINDRADQHPSEGELKIQAEMISSIDQVQSRCGTCISFRLCAIAVPILSHHPVAGISIRVGRMRQRLRRDEPLLAVVLSQCPRSQPLSGKLQPIDLKDTNHHSLCCARRQKLMSVMHDRKSHELHQKRCGWEIGEGGGVASATHSPEVSRD